jgi:hypothetical protein
MYLREHPLCEWCSTDEKPVIAELVHHKIEVKDRPDLLLVWDNLLASCQDCHNKHHHKV